MAKIFAIYCNFPLFQSSYNIERMKKISFRNDILPLKNELYRLALRITLNPAESEDIVQETMIKVWNRRDQWDQIDSIEAFCLTICRNLALDKMKRMDNQSQSLNEGEHDAPDNSYTSNPEEQAMQQDRIALIRRLIDSLPEKQRSVMQLRDFEGKSYKEIANIMAISEDQVKVNIFRARQAIRQKYLETETTLQEEAILRAFFSQEEIPEALRKYQALFTYEQQKEEPLGDNFDARILQQIGEAPVAKTVTLKSRLVPLFRAAAIVAIVLTLGNAAQAPWEWGWDDPKDAYAKYHKEKVDSVNVLNTIQAENMTDSLKEATTDNPTLVE